MSTTVATVLITWGALIALVVIVRMWLAHRKAVITARARGGAS